MKHSAKDLINLGRLGQAMTADGFDALVARAGLNFTYLAGFAYPGTLARHVDLADSPRSVWVIWPRQGELRIVLNAIASNLARRDSWIEHFDIYEGYVEAPINRVTRTLQDMGLAQSKIALELNYVSAADLAALKASLPRLDVVDLVPVMDHVRAVKTKDEIARLKIGADILDEAFLSRFPGARPGSRERDLHAALVATCLAGGSEFTHGILASSRNTVSYGGESDFVFAAGDAIRTDSVAYVKGVTLTSPAALCSVAPRRSSAMTMLAPETSISRHATNSRPVVQRARSTISL